ncbi:hypothetical protein ACH4U6_21360 [Streptomyces netropsis]|uniref:hypothetical protein n=1 Tax=Streptomyces netropsis TaxID=55404 RepID=UPI0037B8093A
MGRHRQPNRAMRAHATAIKAATMMGVAGALAFTFQTTGGNTAAEARSDPRFESMPDPVDDTAEPTAATHRDRSGKPAQAKPAGPSDVTFSAEPKVRHTVRQPTGAVTPPVGAEEPGRAAGAPAGPSLPDVSSLPAVATGAATDAVSGVASGVSGAASAPERAVPPPPAPAPGAPAAPAARPAGGESAQRQAPLSGVVDGLLGGVTGGLLGR